MLAAAAAACLGACSGQPKQEKPEETGLFTGYEIGNPQDMAEIRKDRPDYRPYE